MTAHETHAVTTARQHLHDVADAYTELAERLYGDGEKGGHTAPSSRSPIDLHVATVRMEISAWATWLTRAVVGAHDGASQPWAPPSDDPAVLLRVIADEHLGVFLTDATTAGDFLGAAAEHARRAHAAAWPSGARWIRLHVACPEHSTDDQGRRVPCGGEYRMWMRPEQDTLGDMVCNLDDAHRITPAEWQRAMRRRGVLSRDGAARLVRTMRIAGKVAS